MTDAPIGGWTEPQFDAVRTAFEANFSEHGDVGRGRLCLSERRIGG